MLDTFSLTRSLACARGWLRLLTIAGVAALSSSLMGGAAARGNPPPLQTVAHVDMKRYVGDWYVISNIPYFAEKDCVGSVESYYPRPDGRMDNWFTFHKKSFQAPVQKFKALAWVYNRQTNAEWRVRFLGLITAPYLILDLDRDYQWTVVGHPTRNYGWIMARTKSLPAARYRAILRRLARQGYDPNRFVKVPQTPAQLAAVQAH